MIKVGTYRLGMGNVNVYLDSGYDSYAEYLPMSKKPRIIIGGDHNEWWKILQGLIHEATEYMMIVNNCTYIPAWIDTCNSTTFIFTFNHGVFTKINEDVAFFIAKAQHDLCKVWKKYKK